MDDAEVRRLLQENRTVAVIGISRKPAKAAHRVPAFLVDAGFDVIPINPFAEEVLGRTCYKALAEIPGPVGIVDVFRPSEDALDVVEAAVRRHHAHGDVSLIWLQRRASPTWRTAV